MIRPFTYEKSITTISRYNCMLKADQIDQPLKKDTNYINRKDKEDSFILNS